VYLFAEGIFLILRAIKIFHYVRVIFEFLSLCLKNILLKLFAVDWKMSRQWGGSENWVL
jgi:hypothetical protein